MAKATTVGAVAVDLNLNDNNYDKQLNSKIKSSENAFSSSFKKIGGFIAGAFAVKQVTSFTKECISSASKVQSAFTGLNSIVQGTGNSFSQAQDFIKKYTADGLVSIEETATAYKNLLSRGYNTKQIEDTLTRLKDSAAFGRQASYDLGEAVVTATEGLKNENSILVDNAGVTKNVAKMWEEYAKSIGKSSTNLTQAEKIQAEYNGIMNETRFQVGDAANYTKTFSGQMQQLKFNFNQMTVAIGKVVTPIAQLFIPIINSAINVITKLFEKLQVVMSAFGLKMPDVVSKTTSSISGIGVSSKKSAKDAVASVKKINRAFSNLDEINVLKTKDNTSGNDNNGANSNMGSSSSTVKPIIDSNGSISVLDKIKSKIESIWTKCVILKNNIGEFVAKTIELFQSIWDNVLGPIVIPFFETLSWLWDEHISKTIEKVGEFVGSLVNGALEIYNKLVQPTVVWLLDELSPAWAFLSTLVIGILGSVVATVSDSIGSIIGILDGIIDFITGAFTGNWKKAWNGVKDIFKNVVDGLVGIFKFPINLIIDGINSFIAGLNKIKIPDWVPAVGGKGINIHKIPKLAQGGYVKANNPQLAIVGDNKREGEITAPESKIYEQTLKAIKDSKISDNSKELKFIIEVRYEDGKRIIKKINQAQIEEGEVLLLV